MRRKTKSFILITLVVLSVVGDVHARKGGFSMGSGSRSRGSSGARSGGGLFGGGSRSGGSGGLFGGGSKTSGGGGGLFGNRNAGGSSGNMYGRRTNLGGGTQGGGGGLFGTGHRQQQGVGGGGWGQQQKSRSGLGGLFGGGNRRTGGGLFGGGGMRSRYTNNGIGSRSRSSFFKNAIVGAAAGYLTYSAGRHLIRAAAGPMMWNNRPYYWGSNYYQPRHGHNQMCRMPLEQNDEHFGNVYFQDQSRPREIVWGCGHYEYCCGYECCRGGGASTTPALSIASAFAIIYTLRVYQL